MTARRALSESVEVAPEIVEAAHHAARRASRGYFDESDFDKEKFIASTSGAEKLSSGARRALIEEEIFDQPKLVAAPTVRRGYFDDETDVRDIESTRGRRVLVEAVQPIRKTVAETDTVLLKRVVSAPVSIHRPAPQRPLGRIRKIVAPIGVAAAMSAAVFGGIATHAAATDVKPQTTASNADSRKSISSSPGDTSPVEPSNPQIGNISDGLKGDTIAPVDTSVARSVEQAQREKAEREAARAAAEAAARAAAEAARKYRAPIDGGSMTSPYGPRTSPFGYHEFHDGIDYGIGCGTPVYAVQSGTVVTAQWDGGYGNRVMIKHDDGVTTGYAHLQSMSVRPGQKVAKGDVIARIGSTGLSTGCHLHFMALRDGKHFNPATLY